MDKRKYNWKEIRGCVLFMLFGIAWAGIGVWIFVADVVFHAVEEGSGSTMCLVFFGLMGGIFAWSGAHSLVAILRRGKGGQEWSSRSGNGKPAPVDFDGSGQAGRGLVWTGALFFVMGGLILVISRVFRTDPWNDELGMALFLLFGGIVSIVIGVREKKAYEAAAAKRIRLKSGGHYVMAVITDVPIFWMDEDCPDLYRIDCEYDDPETGTTRGFSSMTLNADPGTKIIGREIPVYLDSPRRYLDYYVDVAYVLDPENWRPDM